MNEITLPRYGDKGKLLADAICSGNLHQLQENGLYGFGIEPNMAHIAFNAACQKGQLDIANWIQNRVGLTNERPKTTFWKSCSFEKACKGGAPAGMLWHNLYRCNDDDVTDAFAGACEEGRLEVAKWLHSAFNMHNVYGVLNTPGSLESSPEFQDLCRDTCRYGQLETIKWLHETFVFSDKFLESLRVASCISCKMGIVEWIEQLQDAKQSAQDN
jgi:hypothetical protein